MHFKNRPKPRHLYLNHLIFMAIWLIGCNSGAIEDPKGTVLEDDTPQVFSLVPSGESGLYFINEVQENNQMNILTYEYLYNGGGVAIGDINRDGLPDVFLSGNLFGGRLFLNKGDLKFEQISETAGVFQQGWSTGVSMVDINADGYDDIYICRSLASNTELRRNVLLINNQDNTFTDRAAEYGLDDPGFSHYASFFDYDRDGDLDLYLLNHRIDFKEALKLKYTTNEQGEEVRFEEEADTRYTSDRLYRNNGNGTFSDVTKAAGLINNAFGLSVTTADIDKDGWVDIYVANDYADKDHIYINNGNGTFTDKADEMLFHMSKNSMGSDIADYNNDGLPDLMSLDMMAEDNERQKMLKGQDPYDLYHAAVGYGLGHQVMRNTLQLNNGNGTFSEIGQLAGVSHTDWSWSPLLADFDNDGLKDLFITNGLYRDLTDLDYRNYTSSQAVNRFKGDVAGHALELTQLMPSNPIANYVYQNNGDLTFTKRSAAWGIDQPAFSNGAAYADLDLDGDLDLITNNFNSEAFLYQNNSREQDAGNYLTIKLKGGENNPKGIGSKITIRTEEGLQYQELSPYRGFNSSGDPIAHFGLGTAQTVASVMVEWPNGMAQELKDVKINQRLELSMAEGRAEVEQKKRDISPLLRPAENVISKSFEYKEDDFIDFKREPLLEHQISNKGPFMAKADVNGDGKVDLYLSGAAGMPGQLFVQGEQGDYQNSSVATFEANARFEDGQPVFLDFDQDGDQDLFIPSGGYGFEQVSPLYENRLYLNKGEGLFSRVDDVLPEAYENSNGALALDFDGDGDQDLFIYGGALPNGYPLAAKSQLLINEGGKFKEARLLPNNGNLGMVNDALWQDLDGDGKKELILVGEWMAPTLLQYDGKRFKDKDFGLEQSTGWWNVLSAADMDGDGDLDLIAGNRGENSYYQASHQKPSMIYAKDFDSNGKVDAFPFYYFNDGLSHPKHTLSEIAVQYPAIRRKFTRFAPYATATVKEFFTDQHREGALKLTATTFSTTYFENLGNGRFKPHALPKAAQFSEVHGILPIDLNQDGHLDLMLTGNNYGTDVEMGRSDGSIGAVLLGNGAGSFAPLPPSESGFTVIGDARGVYRLGSSIIVLMNIGKPKAFELRE